MVAKNENLKTVIIVLSEDNEPALAELKNIPKDMEICKDWFVVPFEVNYLDKSHKRFIKEQQEEIKKLKEELKEAKELLQISGNVSMGNASTIYKLDKENKQLKEERDLEELKKIELEKSQDSLIQSGLKVLEENEQLKEENERLRKAHKHILNTSEDKGREGCTYGDTDYDSLTVVYGYNLGLEHLQDISRKVLNQNN